MKNLVHGLVGAVLGAVVGVLGVVAHSGPVDAPIIGIIIASLLVAVGAWLSLELGGAFGWSGYALAALGVTIWLLFWPPDNDILVSTSGWASEIWGILVVIAAWVPLIVTGRSRSRRDAGPSDEPRL